MSIQFCLLCLAKLFFCELHGAAEEGASVGRQLLHVEVHDVHVGREPGAAAGGPSGEAAARWRRGQTWSAEKGGAGPAAAAVVSVTVGGGVGGASEQATRPRGRPEIRPVGPEEQPLASTRASASELDPGGQHCPARPAPG